jgi:hypothetical protein
MRSFSSTLERSSDKGKRAFQHPSAQRRWLETTCPGEHRADGPMASHALPIELIYPVRRGSYFKSFKMFSVSFNV